MLILVPTRELVVQVHRDLLKLTAKDGRPGQQCGGLQFACLFGATPKYHQVRLLQRGADIVVATPGRLMDLVQEERVCLGQVSYLVIDEADRLFSGGLEGQVRSILQELPSTCQRVLCSATADSSRLAKVAFPAVSTRELRIIDLTQTGGLDCEATGNSTSDGTATGGKLRIPSSIYLCVHVVSDPWQTLLDLVEAQARSGGGGGVLIFVNSRHSCDDHAKLLRKSGMVPSLVPSVGSLHGGQDQGERFRALEHFSAQSEKGSILVCTDVAARGRHINGVDLVINLGMPSAWHHFATS